MAPAKNQARPDWGDLCVWGVDGRKAVVEAGQDRGMEAKLCGLTSFSQVLWPPAERVLAMARAMAGRPHTWVLRGR